MSLKWDYNFKRVKDWDPNSMRAARLWKHPTRGVRPKFIIFGTFRVLRVLQVLRERAFHSLFRLISRRTSPLPDLNFNCSLWPVSGLKVLSVLYYLLFFSKYRSFLLGFPERRMVSILLLTFEDDINRACARKTTICNCFMTDYRKFL